MVRQIFFVLFLIPFIYCALTVFYLFILSFSARFFYQRRKAGFELVPDRSRIAILVPAYREDGIISSTATNLLQLDYDRNLYDIYIIADSFQPATIAKLSNYPLQVLEVKFEKSTKTKSLNEAFSRISRSYDIALICDADNMLKRDFLKRINYSFQNGAKAVQGRRVAKNLDTDFAILDACSEAVNNHIFRKGANAIGLSSPIIGSGMAYEFDNVKNILAQIQAVGGFDKILQLKVAEQGIKIHYLEDAVAYDEKVDSPEAFKQQRKRWVSSQFIYLKQFFGPAFVQLMKGNWSYFNLAVLNNLVLPRAFLFLLLPILIVASLFISDSIWLIFSAGLLVLYLLSLGMGIPRAFLTKDLLYAVLKLPRAIILMTGTLFHIRKANKTFIHTVHTKNEVGHTLYEDQDLKPKE